VLADIAQAAGDDTQALALCAESMALFRVLDDKRHMAWVLTSEGLVAELRGDLMAAYTCYDESRRLYDQAGDPTGLAHAIFRLSTLAMRKRRWPNRAHAARSLYHSDAESRPAPQS